MPHPRSTNFRKRKAGKWSRYNAWRSRNRALDRQRRLDRIAAKQAAALAAHTVPKVPVPRPTKAWCRVRLLFADGTSAGFAIRETPFGLSISATIAGRKVAEVLKAKRRHP